MEGSSSVIWQVHREGQWYDYDPKISEMLEKASKKHSRISFQINGENYYIDWSLNEQVNASTKKHRPIRRVGSKCMSRYTQQIIQKKNFTVEYIYSHKEVKDKITEAKNLTQWQEIQSIPDITEKCSICLCELDVDVVKLSNCKDHHFHMQCISECYKDGYLKCPICNLIYGIKKGTQPPGEMQIKFVSNVPLSSYEKFPTILIDYVLPNGIQGPEHPSPGTNYGGSQRTCYIPYTEEGILVLELLIVAWERGLIFTVGTSVTTGKSNLVVWNGIHHKTSHSGGSSKYGYPDTGYFDRVTKELQDFGITERCFDTAKKL